MEKQTKATKANATKVETTIDKASFDAFIAQFATEKDGVKGFRFVTINDLTNWFNRDGKRVRSIIRSMGANAPQLANGAKLYTFKVNDPFLRKVFDRLANGAQSNGKRANIDANGFYVID